jgi:hypothetical protein
MGLYVHSLSRLPVDLERDYYLYVLDYGWDEPLGDALQANFRRMADLAANNQAVVIAGTDSREFAREIFSIHFDDPQFSWNNINGISGEEVLPAILISTIHPTRFRDDPLREIPRKQRIGIADDKLILIPLRGTCDNASDVVALIERIFRDVAAKKPLAEFSIAKKIRAGEKGAISDALILRPSFSGIGVDLKELASAVWKKMQSR